MREMRFHCANDPRSSAL